MQNIQRYAVSVKSNVEISQTFVAFSKYMNFEKVRVRVRVRLSKIEVRCGCACETTIEVRVCVRHTVKFLATQHLYLNDI